MIKRYATFLFLATLMIGSAHAAIVTSDTDLSVTDHREGATITTFYDSLTNVVAGSAPTSSGTNRVGLDVSDVSGQSITLASAITLDSIYMGYNDQQSSGTFDLRVDAGYDGSFDHTYRVTLETVGDLQTGGGNGGPFHFIQFDLSAANITLGAGAHSFTLVGITDEGEGGFLFGTTHGGDGYAGGDRLFASNGSAGNAQSGSDQFFAVSAVPEPSAALLVLSSLVRHCSCAVRRA